MEVTWPHGWRCLLRRAGATTAVTATSCNKMVERDVEGARRHVCSCEEGRARAGARRGRSSMWCGGASLWRRQRRTGTSRHGVEEATVAASARMGEERRSSVSRPAR
jgi:hypothetical protein